VSGRLVAISNGRLVNPSAIRWVEPIGSIAEPICFRVHLDRESIDVTPDSMAAILSATESAPRAEPADHEVIRQILSEMTQFVGDLIHKKKFSLSVQEFETLLARARVALGETP